MGFFARRSPALLGLDIGASAVKLVELSRAAQPCRVEACAIEPLPPDAAAARASGDTSVVAEAIQCAVENAGSKTRNVAVAISASAAITKTIAMDASLPDADLEAEVLLAADRHLPFPLDDMALDFESLNLSVVDPSKVDVLLAACRLEQVESLEAMTALGGLKAVIADIDSYCLQRAVDASAADSASGPIGLVEFDALSVALIVCDGDTVIFHREEPVDAQFSSPREGPADDELLRVVARLLRLYASAERQRQTSSAAFEPPANGGLNRLLLAGDGASSGFAAVATQRFGVPTELADPFANLATARRVDTDLLRCQAPRLAKAYGLALRAFDDRETRTNRWCA